MTQAIEKPLVQRPEIYSDISPEINSDQPTFGQAIADPEITWARLEHNFILPDHPVESIAQPLLAAALNDSLDTAQYRTPEMITPANMALVVKINQKTIVKAPDWYYVANAYPIGKDLIRRSYSPHLDGDLPAIVMEFLSEEDTSEYSVRSTPPYGKMYFYEQILQIPIYVIFDPQDGRLEIRSLDSSGKYQLQTPDQNGRFWIAPLNLYLGRWYGTRSDQTFHWLRWWDTNQRILLWSSEKIAQEQQLRKAEAERADTEKERAEAEKQRADIAEGEILRLRKLLADQISG